MLNTQMGQHGLMHTCLNLDTCHPDTKAAQHRACDAECLKTGPHAPCAACACPQRLEPFLRSCSFQLAAGPEAATCALSGAAIAPGDVLAVVQPGGNAPELTLSLAAAAQALQPALSAVHGLTVSDMVMRSCFNSLHAAAH